MGNHGAACHFLFMLPDCFYVVCTIMVSPLHRRMVPPMAASPQTRSLPLSVRKRGKRSQHKRRQSTDEKHDLHASLMGADHANASGSLHGHFLSLWRSRQRGRGSRRSLDCSVRDTSHLWQGSLAGFGSGCPALEAVAVWLSGTVNASHVSFLTLTEQAAFPATCLR